MLSAVGSSCSGPAESPGDETGSVAQPVLTDIIPDSLECDRGSLQPSSCVSAPPATIRTAQGSARFVVDGKLNPEEYAGAIRLPYTNWAVKSGGSIFAKVWRWGGFTPTGDAIGTPTNHLQIYLSDIPFYSKDAGELCIFIDNNRFTGPTRLAGSEDRVYCIDLVHGTTPRVLQPRVVGGQVFLRRVQLVGEPFSLNVRGCDHDQSTNAVYRCDAELSISLPDTAFAAPAPTLDPGIGLAVIATGRDGGDAQGSMPEAITHYPPPIAPWVDRRQALTLLFGHPQGFSRSYMSWNIRRSEISKLAGPFDVVDDADVGLFLAGHRPWSNFPVDVAAVQEGWSLTKMESVLFAANYWRKGQGLDPFYAYGPVDFPDTAWRKVINMVAAPFLGNEGSTGGLWILSPLPSAGSGFHAFKACKGEDCFKAKGVQWVRLMLTPPTPLNMDEKCLESPNIPCPPPFSGGDYVDVFNVHLQSDNPELCSDDDLTTDLQQFIGGLVTDPDLADALAMLKQLAGSTWNCGTADREVRRQQLAEIREFVESHAVNPATGKQDRPSIIMGDFNIDGRTLGEEYQSLIGLLGVGPLFDPSSDSINPWPDDFAWDVDHGDIARERHEIDFASGVCSGTLVGSNGGTASTCDYGDNWNGNERYDYILVRPPMLATDPRYSTASWVAGKRDGDDPGMWFSPFPSFGSYGPPPERLSDHKPVVATIDFVKLRYPPLYHSKWNHGVTFRVQSADASDHGDCTTCGPVDPKALLSGLRLHNGQNEWRMDKEWTHICDNNATVSWPADSCMGNWAYGDTQIFGEDAVHTFFAALYDDDNDYTGNDDAMYTFSGDEWPQQAIEWDPGWVRMRGYKDPNRVCGQEPDMPINDNDPIGQTTGPNPTSMTLLCTFSELPPGQQ